MVKTDIIIIGAGPTGLFAVFEAGLLNLNCHLIDSLPIPGGQCSEIYPKKPIYDIPSQPEILAGDLVDNLMKQIRPFQPGFTLGESAQTIEKNSSGDFIVTTNNRTIAAINGSSIDYMIKDPQKYNNKKVIIAGGGDSALDWTIFLANIAKEVTLIHRRDEFRGALDSVEKVQKLKDDNKVKLITTAEVKELHGQDFLESIVVSNGGMIKTITTDYFIPLFGLTPKLGPIAGWGLEIEKNAIKVNNSLDYQTNIPGIYAIGDVNTYPGKLKLILCGFHEATLMCQSAFQMIYPDKKNILKYTTVSGVSGFDGSRKEAKKSTIKAIK